MDCFAIGERDYGIVGCAVGAAYAVLVAEQMFASGCRLLVSITSSGRLPASSDYAAANPLLLDAVRKALANLDEPVERGATWTTDAPFRETEAAIAVARAQGILAVEMEAAALYAFAQARAKPVLCFAHVTNQMGQAGDFEKGEANGAIASLALVHAVAETWLRAQR